MGLTVRFIDGLMPARELILRDTIRPSINQTEGRCEAIVKEPDQRGLISVSEPGHV